MNKIFQIPKLYSLGQTLTCGLVALSAFAMCSQAIAQTSGAVNAAFGTNGSEVINLPGNQDLLGRHDQAMRSNAVRIGPDGAMVIRTKTAVNSTVGVGLVRLLSNGSPDLQFNGSGQRSLLIGTYTAPNDHHIDSNGRIIVVGYYVKASRGYSFATRFLKNGAIDQSFGYKGTYTCAPSRNFNCDWTSYDAVTTDSLGRVLIGGLMNTNHESVMRLLPNGTLDLSFGTKGFFYGPNMYTGSPAGILMTISTDAQNRVLLGEKDRVTYNIGNAYGYEDFRMRLERLTANGQRDLSFGTSGSVVTDLGRDGPNGGMDLGSEDFGNVVFDSAGRILVMWGTHTVDIDQTTGWNYWNEQFTAVARFTANGAADLSFGTNGKLVLSAHEGAYSGQMSAIDENDRLLSVGLYSSPNAQYYPACARFSPDGQLDTSFGVAGIAVSPVAVSAFAQTNHGALVKGLTITKESKPVIFTDFIMPGTGNWNTGDHGIFLTQFLP